MRVCSEHAEVAAAIRKLGRRFDPDVLQATYALYASVQERTPKDGVDVHRDIAYGPHARHRRDVYVPANRPSGAPAVIYFHGGGYVGGERSPMPGLNYDNVPIFFARHGMIGASSRPSGRTPRCSALTISASLQLPRPVSLSGVRFGP